MFLPFKVKFKDPIVASLYEIMTEHWAIKKRGQGKGSTESLSEKREDEEGDNDAEDPFVPCVDDDYNDASLAAALGVEFLAEPVEAWTDSQIPESQLPEYVADTFVDETPEKPQGLVHQHPRPVRLFEKPDLEVDSRMPSKESQASSSTELERTPDAGEVQRQLAPLAVRVTDPLPSKEEYSKEDLDCLNSRIAEIKLLGIKHSQFYFWDLLGLFSLIGKDIFFYA